MHDVAEVQVAFATAIRDADQGEIALALMSFFLRQADDIDGGTRLMAEFTKHLARTVALVESGKSAGTLQ